MSYRNMGGGAIATSFFNRDGVYLVDCVLESAPPILEFPWCTSVPSLLDGRLSDSPVPYDDEVEL